MQSNHVLQTAAVAAKLGLHCVALLENPIGTAAENYLTNGNRLLLDLFNVRQCEGAVSLSSVVVASGSAGTHAGLAVGFEQLMPDVELVGVTVSRSAEAQKPKVVAIQQALAASLELKARAEITLWDDYFAPGYGTPNDEGTEAVKLLARLEGILLDPVYTGKAMAGLIDGISQKRFKDEGPILFVHTGGAPALFAYHPHV